MNVREIVLEKLEDEDIGGLVNRAAECECDLDGLMPREGCAEALGECRPAVAVTCPMCGEKFLREVGFDV
ncbi:MAG: hypothetical protein IJG88_00735 [Eggerthellaceae bacterium]|nr:hypothetical protein [Eggerthellaceae bacterium]